jgi:hypothetical protein
LPAAKRVEVRTSAVVTSISAKARCEIQAGNDAMKTNLRYVLVDDARQANIESFGDCLLALDDGQSAVMTRYRNM